MAERLPDGLAGATPYIRDQEDFSVASREFPPPSRVGRKKGGNDIGFFFLCGFWGSYKWWCGVCVGVASKNRGVVVDVISFPKDFVPRVKFSSRW